MGWSFWDQVTKRLGSPHRLPSRAPCLLLALREARLHVVNCLMESPTWQGTKGNFQETPTEELRPSDLQPMRNRILPIATCLSAEGNPPPDSTFRWEWSLHWHLDWSLMRETLTQRTQMSCIMIPAPQKLWDHDCCLQLLSLGGFVMQQEITITLRLHVPYFLLLK